MSYDEIDMSKYYMCKKIDNILNENGFKMKEQKLDLILYYKEQLHYYFNTDLTHEERKEMALKRKQNDTY